ncbi:MAG: hypothetical protein ACYC5O_22280 [Anaerolineae bacterium]
MLRLTDQEQQEIIRYLEADKPLPERYHFLLFEDKREVELVWNGKTNEVCNVVLPFQVIEQVDEPRAEVAKHEDPLFAYAGISLDSRGRQLRDRSLELTSAWHECSPGRRKLAVKVVDIFGNDTMTIVEVNVGTGG